MTGITSCFPGLRIALDEIPTDIPPITEIENFTPEPDEQEMMDEVDEYLTEYLKKNEVHNKPLQEFLNSVLKKLLTKEMVGKKGINFKAHIVKEGIANAVCYPDGTIVLNTGMLAMLQNEAQLATILGHEITHATHRHALSRMRNEKREKVYAGINAFTNWGMAWILSSMSDFSQGNENESDAVGLELMVRAGYSPSQSIKAFEVFRDQTLLEKERGQKKRDEDEEEDDDYDEENQYDSSSIYQSHPKMEDRVAHFTELVEEKYKGKKGKVRTAKYNNKIKSILILNAEADIEIGNFHSAEKGIKRFLKLKPTNKKQISNAYYYLGELKRQRNEGKDLKEVEKYLKKSVKINPKNSGAYKSMGLYYYKKKNKSKARKAFKRYLKLRPKAQDKDFIKMYINELK